MAFVSGRYDDLCTLVRKRAKAEAAVVLIVRGDRGNGFSLQCSDPMILSLMPAVLRAVAKDIENDRP